jgi:hypothetical protein
VLVEKLPEESGERLRWLRGDAGTGFFQFQPLLFFDPPTCLGVFSLTFRSKSRFGNPATIPASRSLEAEHKAPSDGPGSISGFVCWHQFTTFTSGCWPSKAPDCVPQVLSHDS